MKKQISLLLVVILIFLNVMCVLASTDGSMENFKTVRSYETNHFTDVLYSDWYAESVKIAYELSLVNGTSDTEFSPNDNITIAETITLASRLNNVYYGNVYPFIPSKVWYQTYVDYAVKKGIIKQNEFDNFDDFATRAQFAQIFAAALPDDALKEINQIHNNSIPDVNIQNPYSDSIYKLYRAGVLTGNDSKGTFTPNAYIERTAVAAIVSRMVDMSQRKNITLIIGDDTNNKKLTTEEVSKKCAPAVFYIEVYGFNGKISGSGSGFFVSPNGIAVTNYHVVANSIYREITTIDGKVYNNISIIDCDEENDLALLKVEGSNFSHLEMGDSTHINQGQCVYAIGSPLGLSNTMSEGIISNVSRIVSGVEYIQISVPIDHGSSGGALINESGEVIGITSAGFGGSGDLNLAIPINKAKSLNVNSKEDYFLWSDICYPGFFQILDFGTFSGVNLISSSSTMISKYEEFDIFDFHSIGHYDAGACYGYTMYLYEEALIENGMTKKVISDTESEFISATEVVYVKSDFDSKKISIYAEKLPVFYEEFPALIDFGWFSNISMKNDPYRIDNSLIYSYKWSEYYYPSDYESILYSYFDKLQESGYKYITTKTASDGSIYYLFEGNNLSVVFICSDTEMYIDVCKI